MLEEGRPVKTGEKNRTALLQNKHLIRKEGEEIPALFPSCWVHQQEEGRLTAMGGGERGTESDSRGVATHTGARYSHATPTQPESAKIHLKKLIQRKKGGGFTASEK